MITNPVSLLADPDLVPLVQAIRAEILTGSASPEDIALSLLEQPEAYPDPPRWTQQVEAVDEDEDRAVFVERFVRSVWNETAQQALAWQDETTDVDRLESAFAQLREQDVVVEEFSEWAEMEDDEDDLGAVITPFQVIEDLVLGPVRLPILYRSLRGDDEQLAHAVEAAFREQGLRVTRDGEGHGLLYVDLTWHPHIEAVDPDPEDADLDPEGSEDEEREDTSWFYALFDENMADWGRMYLEKDGRYLEARLRASRLAIIEGDIGGEPRAAKTRMETFDALDHLKEIARERMADGWTRPPGTPDADIPQRGLGV